ncbi:MAG: 50S ribosomal protein L24 [Candidatus Omnitrophota bacterium]
MSLRIRKGDKVQILSGRDKGKSGKVLEVLLDKQRAIVEGVNIVKKHMRKRKEGETGGIKEIPIPLGLAKMALFCGNCQRGVRFETKTMADKSKMRICKKCHQEI